MARIATVENLAKAIGFARDGSSACGRTVFLIGAGCSISAKVPGARDIAKTMVREVARRFGLGDDDIQKNWTFVTEKFKEIAESGGSQDVANVDWYRVYDAMFREFYTTPDHVRKLFGGLVDQADGAINWAHLCLGEIVAKKFVSTVLTTNFDQLVLKGLVHAGVIPVVCDGMESLNRIAGAPSHPQLVELHGSRHTYLLRNRPEDVAEVRDDPRAAAIQQLLQEATVFVAVGYGGREDGVMDLLIRAAGIYPDKELYWVMHSANPDDIGEKASAFLASTKNGGLILGQDADAFFLQLSKLLGVGIPSSISRPLANSLVLLTDLEKSTISNDDVRSEVAAASRRLARLAEADQALAAQDPDLETVNLIRDARLAGKIVEAFEFARKAIEGRELVPSMATLLEEGVEAAIELCDLTAPVEAVQTALEWGTYLDSVGGNPVDQRRRRSNLARIYAISGKRKGYNDNLAKAIELLRDFLNSMSRGDAPLDWAMTQNNLGNALSDLGARKNDIWLLEQAVTAYRAALEEFTRSQLPLHWATTQNNLGNALQRLGVWESGTERLEQAVAAYRAALEERTRDRMPLDWAMTQSNLGNALSALGTRESGTERLEQAVAACRAALEERTRDRMPLDWAMTQSTLGNALWALGARESETGRLEQAVAAYRTALEEFAYDRVPLDWAYTQENLGNVLWILGERRGERAQQREAIAAMRNAAEGYRQVGESYKRPIAERRVAEMEAALGK